MLRHGDGTPTRDFLYVDDAADGIILAGEKYNDSYKLIKVSCEASVWNSVFFLLVTVRQVPLTAIESPIDKLNGLIFLQLIDKTYSPVFNLLMLEIFPTSRCKVHEY